MKGLDLKAALEPFKKDLGPVFPKQHIDIYTQTRRGYKPKFVTP